MVSNDNLKDVISYEKCINHKVLREKYDYFFLSR
jgi:hypothetical protein